MSNPTHLTLVRESLFARTRVFSILRRDFYHPIRQQKAPFYVIKPNNWVVCLARVPDGRLIMVRQFRYGLADMTLEFPAGSLEAGEDPLVAAVRELREETGYVCMPEEGRLIMTNNPNPAIQDNVSHFVYFDCVTKQEDVAWDEHEELGIELYELSEITAMIRQGTILHEVVHAAVFYLEHFV